MGYNWESFTTTSASAEISNVVTGNYEFEVVAVNALGVRSNVTTLSQSVSVLAASPSDVTGLKITPIDQATGFLVWDPATDVSVSVGGSVLIRHQPVTTGATWESSTQLMPSISGNQSATFVPLLNGTYLVKFATSGGIRSSAAASTIVELPTPQPRLLVTSIQEDVTGFTGTLNSMYYSSGLGGILIDSTTFDTLASNNDFDALGYLDSLGGVGSGGEYQFAASFDMGAIYDVNLTRRLSVLPYNISLVFDDNYADLDTWGDFDGIDVADANVGVYVRSTPDNPGSSPTWGEWRLLTNNILRGRGFQFKLIATSTQSSQNIIVNQLGAIFELQQRIERSSLLTSGTSTYTVTFANAFYDSPAVSVTPVDMATGDYFSLTSISATGFQVAFFSSGGSPTSRQFTYTAVGYGRRI